MAWSANDVARAQELEEWSLDMLCSDGRTSLRPLISPYGKQRTSARPPSSASLFGLRKTNRT